MALDEVSRHELHTRLREVLGEEAAGTLMEYLPPVGWADVATKRDLDALGALTKRDIELCRTELTHRIELCRTELKQNIADVRTELKQDIADVRSELKEQIGGLRADMRGEIKAAITSQTRTILFGLVGSNLTLAALAFAAASIR